MTVNTTTFDSSGLGLSRQTDSTGTTHYVRCSCGLLNNERTPDGHKHFYLFDGLGSIVGITKGDGTKENSYDYDPYGIMLHQTEGVSNPWKFAGGFLDSSTGLYKFGTRYDDPTLGRWTQQDPVGGSLGNPDSLNRYLYAGDDPVNFTDPNGRSRYILVPGGIIVNLTPQDIYNFTVNGGAIVAGLTFLSLFIAALVPLLAAATFITPAAVEIQLYSSTFRGMVVITLY